MKELYIDIETYSSVDLKKAGLDQYVNSKDFEILLLAYAFDDKPVICVDLAQGETIPVEILDAFEDRNVLKVAHNANFEFSCLQIAYPELTLNLTQWFCTCMQARYLNMPISLQGLAKIWKLSKQEDGTKLLNMFAKPVKALKVNGLRTRNHPHHDAAAWDRFKSYNMQDVEVTRTIHRGMETHQVPAKEWENYRLDNEINTKGLKIDLDLVEKAISQIAKRKEDISSAAATEYGVKNVNSVKQLKEALATLGLSLPDLTAETVAQLKETTEHTGAKQLLTLRQQASCTSVKKYQQMLNMHVDGILRNTIQHYGTLTGRSAGRGVQPHNLPSTPEDFDLSGRREALKRGRDLSIHELKFLVRTAFVPREGCTFVITDFASIEARVLAFLAGETWRTEAFENNEDIYKASYARMQNIRVVDVTKTQRQTGKIAELALGYGGGVKAVQKFSSFCTELARKLVERWRNSNSQITQFWNNCMTNARKALYSRQKVLTTNWIFFTADRSFLRIGLPSGRELHYFRPRLEENGISYMSPNGARVELYGGKLVENIVQAVARDLLFEKLRRFKKEGYNIVLHVHDEIVLETPTGGAIEDSSNIGTLMREPSEELPGLRLDCSVEISKFYKK